MDRFTAVKASIAIVLLSSLPLPLLAGEGVLIRIETKTQSSGPQGPFKSTSEVEYRILDDRLVQDVFAGGQGNNPMFHTTAIYLDEGREIISVFHMNKSYRIDDSESQRESFLVAREGLEKQGMIGHERPVIEATDEEKTIQGYLARKYVATTDQAEMTYWLVDDDALRGAQEKRDRLATNPTAELMNLNFPDPASFPGAVLESLVVSKTPFGEMSQNTTISFEFDVVIDDGAFEIPSGYSAMPGSKKK